MGADGTLIIDTTLDDSGVKEGASRLGDIIKGTLGANFLQAGLEKLAEFSKKGIDLASDLEEVQNVVDVTFGEGAQKIEQFAKTASASYGLTELQTKQFSGTLGAMVKSMGLSEEAALEMSMGLVGLTGDMASFYNLDHETAFEKIRSGISGETEPLKALGINMSVANLEAYALTKGMKKAYDQMTEVEKVQLRYGYIMEQTADAQGDFARTQDGFANQVRLLQNNLDTMAANIGAMLIPTLTKAVGWVNELFAGSETNASQAAIDEAISSLDTVEQNIENLKNKYAKEAIKVRIEYEEAGELIDTLEQLQQAADRGFGSRQLSVGMSGEDVTALQQHLTALGYEVGADAAGSFGEGTKAAVEQYQRDMGLKKIDGIAGVETFGALASPDVAALVGVTNQLLEIYPQLAEYVGENGVLSLEAEQVRALAGDYRQLAVEKLAAARVEEIGGVYADALIDMEMLKHQRSQAEEELRLLNERKAEMTRAAGQMSYDYSQGNMGSQRFVDSMQSYFDATGAEDTASFIERYGASDLFGDDGMLKTAEEIGQIADGLKRLDELYRAIAVRDASGSALGDEIAAQEKAIQTADEAIKKHQSTLDQAYEQWQLSQAALANLTAKGELVGETVMDAAQNQLNKESLRVQADVDVRYNYQTGTPNGSHATGLSYVPYDGYLARLHVGERVLTAAEAREYGRSGGAGIDYDALAAAVRRANVGTKTQPILAQLVVDGKVLAETLAEPNRTAIGGREKRISAGVGR